MTKFTDLQIGRVGAPDGTATTFEVEASGTATFTNGGLSTLKVVDAVLTAQGVTADNTGAAPVPASAATWVEVEFNGTTYVMPLFTKAT